MNDTEMLERIARETDPGCVVGPADAQGRPISPTGHQMAAVPVLRPASTAQVVTCLRLAAQAGRSLIPIGGGTNYARATLPASGTEWYLSLERMNRIEEIDAQGRLAVVGAGVVLQTLQEAARDHGVQFAVDLGGRGSATVGGLISTNAGGERVLRYGMMREQVLGLEVVLADGRVLDLMNRVLKNNAGYDLKQLFIGTEGTLGVVTRAVLRLRAAPRSTQTALLSMRRIEDLAALLDRIESRLGGTLSAFEVLWPEFYTLMCGGDAPRHRPPVAHGAPGYVLMDAEGGDPQADAARFEAMLGELFEDDLIADAAIAQSDHEREAFWAIRNDIPYISQAWGPRASFDISVPVARIPEYVVELRAALEAAVPGARALVFGHAADNNLHVGVSVDGPIDPVYDRLCEAVYAGVLARDGSLSAEHGIGLLKRESLARHKPAEVIGTMQSLKSLFDPGGLLNPDKVVRRPQA